MSKLLSTNWAPWLSVLIIIGFVLLLFEHPFDPEHIVMNIDDEETITIIHQNTTRNDVYHPNNSDDTYDIILSNPLHNKQCQNALIDRYNISKNDFISTYYNETLYNTCKPTRIWDHAGIWTKEYLDAISTHNCFVPRLMLRTTLTDNEYTTTNPVFYHIPKSASSSTATMTTNYFNFGSKWVTRTHIIQHPYNSTLCGFTFVRDPIKRFISGYYTINSMIFGENELNFTNYTKPKYEKYKFIKTFGEPQRFEMFLDELIENPFLFYSVVPLRHIATQTYFLSTFYGSNMDFIGKVENYNKHWIELLNYGNCSRWFRNQSNILRPKRTNIETVIKGMYHLGFDADFYGRWNKRMKYKEYIDAMDMDIMIDNKYSLPPIYHKMTREIYDKMVNFYYQDFVCFGYGYDYDEFINNVISTDGKL